MNDIDKGRVGKFIIFIPLPVWIKEGFKMKKTILIMALTLSMYSGLLIADTNIALQKANDSLSVNWEKFGPVSKEVSADYKHIAKASRSIESSINYSLKALKIDEKILKAYDPEIARDYFIIGNAYYSHKQHRTAIFFLEKSAELREKNLGEQIDTAEVYLSLANVYESYGEPENVLVYLKKGLKIQEKILGKDDEKTKVTRINIAYIENKLTEEKAEQVSITIN